ncbi:uncharacterized protein OCT59_009045 [Rhizophagus irregularis]|uniref:uncharacterized protein n=1 Tax=Rhizophagus irregularis TaxID=588596 RepID=UPI00332D82C6|nr:hypothetical protein OCT59_009045 [Rhizophagus irregularis]
MGITPSREDFVALEGYAKKSEEERRAIIQNAGMEITDNDKEIAQFLGSEDEILGCFIRGIITICLRHFNNQRTKEFNEYIEDYKTATNDMIQQKTVEMNEWARLKEEQWNIKEEYYFKNTSIKAHQIQTELGAVDNEDRIRIEKQEKEKIMNECRKITMNNLDEDSDKDEEIIQHTWEIESNTPSEESWDEGKMNQKYHVYNNASHQTNENTNNTSRMQVENKNRNFTKSRDQSLTMAITADHNMGEKSNKSKESVHQPKSEKDLKYFAGLFTVQIRDGQTDQSIIDYLNTNKILEYHVNTLGRTTHHGNEYTYLGFFTEAAKNDFINDGRILGTIGKFRDLEWLNKLNKTIIISATGIDGENTDINEVIQAIEDKLGKLKNVTQKTGNGKWISMKLEMDIKCTEDELFNTWGVLVKNKMIKIEPMNYKHHITKQRGRIMAEILDIPNEIDETTFSKNT